MGGLNLESGSLFSTSTYGVFLTGDKPSMTMTGGSVRAAVEGIRGQFGASIVISGGTVESTNKDISAGAVTLLGSSLEIRVQQVLRDSAV